ncbi:hypothetical protein B0H63DRAFT_410660 [Podospora didyma]|uniref:SET domain-containing protein n=1 Tax=Podospora didyma TaxID=330526 RepID=A0AAE0NZX9_9PEZI|nr:hypothetical protein B0H63DRAFT_410660 [Podospora didyma]
MGFNTSPFFSLSAAIASVLVVFTLPVSSSSQCPNRPGGRLQSSEWPKTCPVPGQLGIVEDPDYPTAVSWDFAPRCMVGEQKENATIPRIHCLFTAADFRNGHGISLVASTTVTSHLLGLGALEDRPDPLAAQKRAARGPAYDIVDVPGKGKGVVANRRIRRGEIIIVDFPAVLIGTHFLTDAAPHHRRRILKQAIKQLPERTRERVNGLTKREGEYEVDSILGQNSNSVVLGDGEIHVGLFTEAARINHSCRPNAYFRFSEERLTMEVGAYRQIETGEEIVMSYVPVTAKHTDRRNYLKENWGFDCKCSLCLASELDVSDSEGRRRRMTELKESVLHARREGFFQDAINMAGEWLMFSEWESLPPLESEFHDTLSELYLLNGDMVNATRHGRMALDEWVKLGSVDDDQLERSRLFLRGLSLPAAQPKVGK